MCSPCTEGLIRTDEESLLGWWGFGEIVGHICAKNHKVLHGGDSIENARASLIYAVCVGVVEYTCLAALSRSVASATGLLSFVANFHSGGPHKIKNGLFLFDVLRDTKHALGLILI